VGTKTLVGCSVIPLVLAVALVAMLGWGGSAYVALTRDQVELDAAWARMENGWLHERQLVGELLDLARASAARGSREFDDLAAALDRADDFVLTPELMREGGRMSQLFLAQARLRDEFRRFADAHAAALADRSPSAVERIRAQAEAAQARAADGRARFEAAAARYNQELRQFPQRVVGALLEFRACGIASPASEPARAERDVAPAPRATPGGSR